MQIFNITSPTSRVEVSAKTEMVVNLGPNSHGAFVVFTALPVAATVNLPPPRVLGPSDIITVKDEAGLAGTNNIVIVAPKGFTIDGAASKTINTNFGSIRVYSSGANWFTA